ncbi:hypothetical protein NQ314_006520 [Rhamnusium bicolor]|uniref:Uncharacterized protein n=1 Tax=Rhamnusium bicolor TaxID=1586634 RepID=A0AAV8Z0R9_9CUCU|nr:hypothetical protein NQ314_006520 [Rhamnusium bicolor]
MLEKKLLIKNKDITTPPSTDEENQGDENITYSNTEESKLTFKRPPPVTDIQILNKPSKVDKIITQIAPNGRQNEPIEGFKKPLPKPPIAKIRPLNYEHVVKVKENTQDKGTDSKDEEDEDYINTICYTLLLDVFQDFLQIQPRKGGDLFWVSTNEENNGVELTPSAEKYNQISQGKLLEQIKLSSADGLRDFVATESQNLTLPDVNVMLEVLTQRKQLLEAESCAAQNRLLLEFLKHLLKRKRERQAQIAKEITIIEYDIEEVGNKLKEVHNKCPTLEDVERTAAGASETDASTVNAMKKEMIEIIDNIGSSTGRKEEASSSETSSRPNTCLALRRRRMHIYFDDFVDCYFSTRSKDIFFGKEGVDKTAKPALEPNQGLDQFRESLIKFSTYNSLRVLATLNYSTGVTKRIKVFDYSAVVKDLVSIHYPCIEMVSRSKISCVSWHTYHKSTLASSDYEGTVTIWDASTGQRTKTYQEHEKRCWSVDFNCVDTRLIASGSDDARVKLYSLNEEHSVATLEAKANVCCVKFNPRSSSHLAFGSADHCVHYYDLRNMKEAVAVFKGHKKAVSYVKFLNSEEIVSASTDSQLKMWSINTPYCLRSFVGHINEKNFVGLATDGDYVACGSENNALFVYYKGLSKKLFSYKFEAVEGVLEQERREDDMNEFVSAVCWKQNSNVVVAANSRGIINILELV